MTEQLNRPPVILLGGDEIGLSIARSLAPRGIRVLALATPNQPLYYSRHAERIRLPPSSSGFWAQCAEYLTSSQSDELAGSVLLATQDEAISLLTERRAELDEKFLLDLSNPQAQRLMLDKVATYEAARAAGVPTPRFWILRSREELQAIAGELAFPLIVKPRLGHLFKAKFRNAKHIVARNFEDVENALETMAGAGLDAFLVETVPGPDDLLCSYYTYLDIDGRSGFDFTKRVIRRFPKNMGQGTYHVTDHVPGIKELSLRLCRHVGLQGLANVEFKLDPRDGIYKLIECNARFTGGNPLAVRSGVDIAEYVYCRITGRPVPEIRQFRCGVHLWHPLRDFAAYRELHRLGDLDFRQWVMSLLHPQTFPVWSWRDPGPALMPLVFSTLRKLRGKWQRLRHRPAFP